MSRRLVSNFFTSSSSNSNALNNNDNDTASINSEHSVHTANTFDSNIERKKSFGINISISNSNSNEEIDYFIRNLYQDPDILERKCKLSYVTVRDVELGNSDDNSDDYNEKIPDIEGITPSKKSLDTVPLEYFDKDYDPILTELNYLHTLSKDESNIYFMNKIPEVDANKDIVVSHLFTKVHENIDDLMDCMSDVHDVDDNLFEAVNKIKSSRTNIKKANIILNKGPILVSSLHNKKIKLQTIHDLSKSMKNILEVYTSMMNYMKTGELGFAAENAKYLSVAIEDKYHKKLNAFTYIFSNISKNLLSISQKADKALMRLCCRKFAVAEYTNIIHAYLILDHMSLEFHCMEGLAGRIQRFQLDDIDNCLHTALLEFIYANQYKKQKAAMQLDIAGIKSTASTMNASEMMDLAEVSLNELYQRITPELVAPCIIRSCELFTESIHTNYLISQWHLRPFNKSNENFAYLHKSKEFNVSEIEENLRAKDKQTNTGYIISDLLSMVALENINKLQNAYDEIYSLRVLLWDDLLKALVEMLRSIPAASTIFLYDWVAVTWAIDAVIRIGEEFCNSSCLPLVLCLDLKCQEYCYNIHLESFQMLRQMVEAEPFTNVPIRVNDYGGVLGILKSKIQLSRHDMSLLRLVYKAEKVGFSMIGFNLILSKKNNKISSSTNTTTDSMDEISNKSNVEVSKQSILQLLGQLGNPFHFMTEDDSTLAKSDDFSENSTTEISDLLSHIFSNDNINNTLLNNAVNKSRRNQEMNDVFVVTQSILNGLAKYTGKYLQLMYLFPNAANDLFEYLCELYDFYLCFIFNGFIPVEEKIKFLAKFTKMNLPAPFQFKDFEALKFYLDRTMNKDILNPFYAPKENDSSNTENSPNQHIDKKLSSFLVEPSLADMTDQNKCYGLIQRIVAAESCWFAARIMNEIKSKLCDILPPDKKGVCEAFVTNYQIVSSQLRSLIYRSVCPLLLKSSWLSAQIVDFGGWDSRKLKDTHHEFVDKTVKNCKEVWEFISAEDYFSDASSLVREQFWMELCTAAFDTILESFSKVRKCSSEGRALLTMDIAALQDGLDSIHTCRPPRGKDHIDNYIRGSYYNHYPDLIQWVQENWQSYPYRQIYGMLTLNLASVLNSKPLKDALTILDNLYVDSDDDSVVGYYELFNPTSKRDDGSQLLKTMSQRFMGSANHDT